MPIDTDQTYTDRDRAKDIAIIKSMTAWGRFKEWIFGLLLA